MSSKNAKKPAKKVDEPMHCRTLLTKVIELQSKFLTLMKLGYFGNECNPVCSFQKRRQKCQNINHIKKANTILK